MKLFKTTKPEKEEEKENDEFLDTMLDFMKTFCYSIITVFVVVHLIARPIRVKGNSMYPTLDTGSLGLSCVLKSKLGAINRFDIAVIYIQEKNEYLIKRVIGLPGDTVEYKNGKLYINGAEYEEKFLDTKYRKLYSGTFMEDVEPVTLGEDEYYCLGDNRPSSRDSRYYGSFNKKNIIAVNAFIITPLSEMGVKG